MGRQQLAERIERLRRIVERDELDSAQLAKRLGIRTGDVWRLARRAGLETKIKKRNARELNGGDF